ncbi:MAG TPA: hypothetical protein ENG33_00495 [Chloroflexi bacterium]|nr:hypothetical protein [Chloroflexota bacterium]
MPTTEEYVAQIEATLRRFSSAAFVLQATITSDMRPGHQAYVVGEVTFVDFSRLHFREFIKEVEGKAQKVMYVYHYQTAEGELIFRYDNSQHRPALGFREHKHTPQGIIEAPGPALEDVLAEIAVTKEWV